MKILLSLLFSFNVFAAPLEADKNIKASDLNENLSFLFQTYIKEGVYGYTTSSKNKEDIALRELNFTKKYDNTKLIISHSDVVRAHGSISSFCTVYLEIAGQNCSNGSLHKLVYTDSSYDINAYSSTDVCNGIPKGNHTLRVRAKATAHSGNYSGVCEFAWAHDSSFLMYVKESY